MKEGDLVQRTNIPRTAFRRKHGFLFVYLWPVDPGWAYLRSLASGEKVLMQNNAFKAAPDEEG